MDKEAIQNRLFVSLITMQEPLDQTSQNVAPTYPDTQDAFKALF